VARVEASAVPVDEALKVDLCGRGTSLRRQSVLVANGS